MQQYTWFYSLKSPLSELDAEKLAAAFESFLQKWKSHGIAVEGEISIRYNRFVIARSNPERERPSGCSIDTLKRTVEQVFAQKAIEWLDSGYIFYRDAEGAILPLHFRDIPSMIASGRLHADTVVFDHSLDQSDDLDRWEVTLAQTWLKRYLPAVPSMA
jgi:hypothetical protein